MAEKGPGPVPGGEPDPQPADAAAGRVGLCARCRHARVQASARGSRFWRCLRADTEAAYLRYPPLPVRLCPGFESGRPGSGPEE